MHNRIASELARIEAKYPNAMGIEEIYDLLKENSFQGLSLNFSRLIIC
jgi:hypothetical protein